MQKYANSDHVSHHIIHTKHVKRILLDYPLPSFFIFSIPELFIGGTAESKVPDDSKHGVSNEDQEVTKEEILVVTLWIWILCNDWDR